MPIEFEYQTYIQCDEQDCMNSSTVMMYKGEAKKHFKGLGWSVGKKVMCPDCVDKKERENEL